MTSAWFVRANVCKALATATGSSLEMIIPVGPLSRLFTAARLSDSASFASRFFTTLYSADTERSCFRRSLSCWTVSPRYSASSTVFTPLSRRLRSSTLSTFSCVGTISPALAGGLLEEVGNSLRVDGHAGAHRRRHGQRPQIGPLRRGR